MNAEIIKCSNLALAIQLNLRFLSPQSNSANMADSLHDAYVRLRLTISGSNITCPSAGTPRLKKEGGKPKEYTDSSWTSRP
jgi:hypothetical protein